LDGLSLLFSPYKLFVKPHPFFLVLLSLATLAAAQVDESDPEVLREINGFFGPGSTGPFRCQNGIVTSSSAHATLAGVEILRAGGNAFDAAVAVQFALGVTEPYGSGIGGGLFAMGFTANNGGVFSLDGREEAPADFRLERFMQKDGKTLIPARDRFSGGNAVGVPGTLAACVLLLRDHGTMTLAQTLEPAIRLARDGFRISEAFAANLSQHWDRLSKFPASRKLFGREDGGPLRKGDFFQNPDLAETLSQIAEKGAEWFYRHELAGEIVNSVRGDSIAPGVLSLPDLENYRPVYRTPIRSQFQEYEIFGMGMPSSGGVTLALMFNMLEEAGLSGSLTAPDPGILIDIQNLAFADRNQFMGDADHTDVPVDALLAKSYAKNRMRLLSKDKALSVPVEAGLPAAEESPSTTHFCVVDNQRNAISVTSTIEQHFGSGLTVPGRGFQLNNQLTDFTLEKDAANAPGTGLRLRRTALPPGNESLGGKRPRSSMTPTLVLKDDKIFLVIGSPGGSRIIGVVFNALIHRLVMGENIQQAVNSPRIIARNGPPELETPLLGNDELVHELVNRGYHLQDAQAVGAVQAIEVTPAGWLLGAADPRREGVVLGY
jgi:gamma-glutamyltranspeptidase/glutathione hydrolase